MLQEYPCSVREIGARAGGGVVRGLGCIVDTPQTRAAFFGQRTRSAIPVNAMDVAQAVAATIPRAAELHTS